MVGLSATSPVRFDASTEDTPGDEEERGPADPSVAIRRGLKTLIDPNQAVIR
jgi:hypothetical protein